VGLDIAYGGTSRHIRGPGANPAQVEDFGDKDLLQILNLAHDRRENRYPLFLITRQNQIGSVPVEQFNS
jgi:hypothetical protein